MDSVTQVVLGSAVGYAVLGKELGRKTAVYGAILGTLPDLDVFVPFAGPVEAFTFHRSFSHSLLIQLLVTPLLVWLFKQIHTQAAISNRRWFLFVYLILTSHALLDSFTVYGTQLLWPIIEYPFGFSTIFIIDPMYTLPLVIAVLCFCIPNIKTQIYRNICFTALLLSSAYILWGIGAKWHIDDLNKRALAEANIDDSIYVSTPAPLTTFLWRSVVVDHNAGVYYEVFTSIFDDVNEVSIDTYPTQPYLLDNIQTEWGVQRLQWFTKGLYAVSEHDEYVILSDLRMGIEGSYVFGFKVGERDANDDGSISKILESDYEQLSARPNLNQLGLIFKRINDPNVALTPEARTQALDNEVKK